MKKLFTIILLGVLTQSNFVAAQFIFEHKYTIQTGMETPFLTDLGNNNYKYVLYDFYHDLFSLYNIDHSPYMLDIPLAVSGDSGQKYQLGYITNSLFDCDSSNIEYALMSSSPRDTLKFYVFRTDGTLIFSKDSVTVPYGLAQNVGSVNWQGIMNTNAGAKLMLFNRHLEFFTYSLCGILPENITEVFQSSTYVKTSPVPASQEIDFSVIPPSNIDEYELIIYNSSFQTIKRTPITKQCEVNLSTQNMSSGTYFYSLQNKNKIFQTGKLIISK